MKRLLRDPLVQFLLVGAIAFGVHRARAPQPTTRIVVREADVTAFAARLGRPLTPESRAAIVSQLIEDEALVREAIKLGLPANDLVVRRRLAQTMGFLAEASSPIALPTDDELRQRFEANGAPRSEDVFSVDHVFVRAGDGADARAKELLVQLPNATTLLGDPFARGHRFESKTIAELAGALGDGTAPNVAKLALNVWSGPFTSPLGLHLLRVTARAKRTVTFEEEKERLRVELTDERRARARNEALRRLLASYVVELPDGATKPAVSLLQ